MTKIEIEAADGTEAKKIKNILAEIYGCKLEILSTPIDSKRPILMQVDCPEKASDFILDNIKEPNKILTKLKPDRVSYPAGAEWNTEKRRKNIY